MEQTITRKYQYSQKQVGLLTKAMLIAGLCFLAVCGGAWGISEAFLSNPYTLFTALSTWLPVFLLIMLAGMIISMLWINALSKKSAIGVTILIYVLYIGLESLAFGYIFALIRTYANGFEMIALAFGITGGIFLLGALMSKLMSLRGIFTFGALMGACGMAVGILAIVSLVMLIVCACAPSMGAFMTQQAITFGIMLGLSVIVFGYMVIDMWSITKSEQFLSYFDAESIPNSFVWYLGYKLLCDLLNVFLIVLWFILRFARKN